MPYSQTKNTQSPDHILKMVNHCFQTAYSLKELRIWELTEGFFNAAYEVVLPDGRELILKVAPPGEAEVMSYERNIMFAEVDSMKLVSKYTEVPVAKVLAYDDTDTVCPSHYFFMEKLPGSSLSSIKKTLDEEQQERIYFALGQYASQINGIEGKSFGYYGQPGSQGTEWFAVFSKMLITAFEDAGKKQIPLAVEPTSLFSALEKEREIFQEVTKPKLVHWDLWDGNVLIREGQISGLIDFERCLWGEPLMEVNFRDYARRPEFLAGYGRGRLSRAESRRCLWYDLYLYLLMSLEHTYRHYETTDMYEWASARLRITFEEKILPGI